MTPAQWKKLATSAAARSVRCGPVPGVVARQVLLALLWRLADGAPSRSQAELAQEMGMAERAVRDGIRELQGHGLVWLVRDPDDARRRLPQVNEAHVKAWAAGELELEGPEIGAENVDIFRTYSKADTGEIGPYPRARAAMSSSSSSFSSSSPAPTSSEEAFAQHAAMLDSLKRWGFRVGTPGAKEYVWGWVGRYSVERVSDAAMAGWRHGASNVAYLESVLEGDEARQQFPGTVRRFEEYQGRRPWHFVEAESREQRAESQEETR